MKILECERNNTIEGMIFENTMENRLLWKEINIIKYCRDKVHQEGG